MRLINLKTYILLLINPNEISEYEINWIIERFKGVHIKPEWINSFSETISIKNNIYSIIQEAKLPLFLHMGYIYNINQIKFDYVSYINYLLKYFPNLRLILEHCGGGLFLAESYAPWEEKLKMYVIQFLLLDHQN